MNKTVLILAFLACFTFATWAAEANENDNQSSIKVSADIDSEDRSREKLEDLMELIGKFDKDAAKELEVKFEGLSKQQKLEILEKMGGSNVVNIGHNDIPDGGIAVAIVAIVMVFGTPIFILLALLWFSSRRRRHKMEMMNTYIQSGQEVPAHVLSDFDDSSTEGLLRSGITLTAVGLGVIIGFAVAGNEVVSGIGFIPLFIGLGRLGFWYMDERKAKQSESK